METYIAVVHKDEESSFGVSFPDFPGCVTSADSMEAAQRAAREALLFHIEGMKEDGEAIPPPSSPAEIAAGGALEGSYATLLVTVTA
jgi:predicted RNase H-like HicB family nuclease